jgi:hypothetical protein
MSQSSVSSSQVVKVHLSNSARIKLVFLPRIVVAIVLVLALLSGIVPFRSASAGNLCTMACCAGLPPHTAGSCHMEMPAPGNLSRETTPEPASESEPDKLCGLREPENGAPDVTAGAIRINDDNGESSSLNLDAVTVDASDHCRVHSQTEEAGTQPAGDSNQVANIAAHSFAKPCPPECGGGATGSGVRRPPDAATLVQNARPKSTFVRKYPRHSQDSLFVSACGAQVRPRGPPLCFS